MDLRHLRYFVAVAEELHFGRAAGRLHISQPPLSRQIRALEDELGLRLFDRNRNGVALTNAGTVFLGDVRRTFEGLELAVTRAQQAARGALGSLRIGYVGSAVYIGLPEAVRSFRERFPDVVIAIRQMSPSAQVAALLEGRVDLGFARAPVHEPSLHAQVVLDEELVAALPAGHALAGRKRLGLAQLAREPFLIASRVRGPGFHDYVLSVCRAAGFTPRIVQDGSHLDVLSLVAAGIGVAIVPASLRALRERDVLYRPLRERPRTQVVAIMRTGKPSEVLREFVGQLEPARFSRARAAPSRSRVASRRGPGMVSG